MFLLELDGRIEIKIVVRRRIEICFVRFLLFVNLV